MKFCLSMLVSLFVATNAFAAPSDIVSGSTGANIVMAKDSNDDYKPTFNVAFEMDHVFDGGLQVGGLLGGSFNDDDNVFSFLVGPGYNLNAQDIANSFYATAKIGFVRADVSGDANTEFAALVEGGKRFKLSESVSYSPGLVVTKVFADENDDAVFTVNIFKFSFLF